MKGDQLTVLPSMVCLHFPFLLAAVLRPGRLVREPARKRQRSEAPEVLSDERCRKVDCDLVPCCCAALFTSSRR